MELGGNQVWRSSLRNRIFMKTLLIILFLVISLEGSGQGRDVCYRHTPHYRPAPELGECICIGGILVMAASYLELSSSPTFNQSMKYTGLSMCAVGVTIDINKTKRKTKFFRRIKFK